MKKYFKFIVACVLSFSIVISSLFAFSFVNAAYSTSDAFSDIVDVVSNNVHDCINFVGNTTSSGWKILNRTVDNITDILCPQRNMSLPSTPVSSSPISPSYSTSYNDYTLNYYNVSPSSNISLSYTPVTNYEYNNYFDFSTSEYYDVTNNVYYNTYNEYTSYSYSSNTFITETYNSVVYTYVNPSTSTVDCYVVSFEIPSGDDSFNYSSGFCKGLYWTYGVTNYDYEVDDSSLVALWHLDGDTFNSIPNSEYTLHYNPVSFENGKFDLAMRLSATSDMYISHSSGSMPSSYCITFWHYNGNPLYKASPIGWHFCELYFVNGVKHLYVDGIKSHVTTSLPTGSVYIDSPVQYSVGSVGGNGYVSSSISLSDSHSSLITWSAYEPLREMYLVSSNSTFAGYPSRAYFRLYPSSSREFDSAYKGTVLDGLNKYTDSYSGYGMNAPHPLHYPPITVDGKLLFLYTSQNSVASSTFIHLPYGGGPSVALQPNSDPLTVNRVDSSDNAFIVYPSTPTFTFNQNGTINTFNVPSRSFVYYSGNFNSDFYKITSDSVDYTFTPFGCITENHSDVEDFSVQYDLSNDFFDEIAIYINRTLPDSSYSDVPVSRTEFQVGYVAPSSFTSINGIGVQSTVPVNQFRIGGVIPTVTHEGDVWFKIENGYCTSCVQFYSGAWHEVNFGVFDGVSWRNGYTYNFYNLSFSANDYDSGSVPASVINYYYGDTYNVYNDYFKDNQSEKETALSWWTSLIGLISGAFTAIVPFLTSYLGFLPIWLTVPFLTFIPILLILLIVKIKDIFK